MPASFSELVEQQDLAHIACSNMSDPLRISGCMIFMIMYRFGCQEYLYGAQAMGPNNDTITLFEKSKKPPP